MSDSEYNVLIDLANKALEKSKQMTKEEAILSLHSAGNQGYVH